MKNLLFLLLPVGLILVSCGNIEKYQEQVNELSANWDNMTTTVTETINKLNESKKQYQRLLQGTNLSEESRANLPEDAIQVIDQTNAKMKAEVTPMYDELTKEVTDFSSQWQEASTKLEDLKGSLAEGKLPEGAESTISELQELLNTAKSNVGDWNSQIEDATAKSREIYSAVSDMATGMTADPSN